ncbi:MULTISPECIES: hypothetical protein [unclassified Sphingomonas]|uniref:hypothetical protein n=1 Tax=unclassified Sphingomonas TaxID=196159 RepID=UPI000926D315|nr:MULTISPECIES: hypothetical protein [unclassified Sphingomonas]MBN8847260.1 hypothetical protein [Sphingomonas sp.]OJV33959.1 MAG: hypothetical protein BGO24_11130 [Sphingomonas sp. 67-36]
MSDTPLQPMTDQDAVPTAGDAAQAADPLKNGEGSRFSEAKQALTDNTVKLREQAGDRARGLAEDGKARASSALGQLSQLLSDAAGQVDDKLGEQYGQYARNAAEKVQGFSSQLDEKSVDDLIDSARDLVRKSPGVAIGAAAAVGFVVARLLTAGLDQRDRT